MLDLDIAKSGLLDVGKMSSGMVQALPPASVSNLHEKLGEAMPKYRTDLMSNAKYGETLHPHASKQYLHLPNCILSHTNQCEGMAETTKQTTGCQSLITCSGASEECKQ